jgi:hypothetical protein
MLLLLKGDIFFKSNAANFFSEIVEKSIFPASDRCQHHKDVKDGVGSKLLAKKVEQVENK